MNTAIEYGAWRDWRDVRVLAGWSKSRTAFMAGVSVGTVSLFEADPRAITSDAKRSDLVRLYHDLAIIVGVLAPHCFPDCP